MEHTETLDRLAPGRGGEILSLDLTGSRRRRMLDLGFAPGAAVAALQAAPRGGPVAYAVCGAVIALRRQDAAAITVAER